eukprot:m.382958 g.382958  ORF g.382958 m.382958 type:complete len:147 (+) comp16727_c1_seq3:1623-2063(+)
MPSTRHTRGANAVSAPLQVPESYFIPFLRESDEESWQEFKTAHEAYVIRGGTMEMRKMIFSGLLPLMEIELAGINLATVSDKDFVTAMDELFSPVTKTQALESLRLIKMGPNPSFDRSALARYCSAFVRKRADRQMTTYQPPRLPP